MNSRSNVLSYDRARRLSASSRSSAPHAVAGAPRVARRDEDSYAYRQSPRAAVTTFEEEQEEEPVQPGLRGKWQKLRHDVRKARAERKFNKQFESDSSASGEAGPRAALYKAEMGSTHKRASRMRDQAEAGSSARRKASQGLLSRVASSKALVSVGAVVACLALACAFLYAPAKDYYYSVREHARAEAELLAVQERQQQLQEEIETLGTEAGVADRARQEFGWVMQGENSVFVQGVEDAESSGVAANVVPGSVKAPETWYSPFLDKFFGLEQ